MILIYMNIFSTSIGLQLTITIAMPTPKVVFSALALIFSTFYILYPENVCPIKRNC